jgi:hypothetical protein
MNLSFQKLPGRPDLGLAFCWRLEITTARPQTIADHLIPELFLDYWLIQRGAVTLAGAGSGPLPAQSLKTLQLRPLSVAYQTPLVLFGARLTLSFAEWFWEPGLAAHRFLPQSWVSRPPTGLADFAAQLAATLENRRARKTPYPVLTPDLEESPWLSSYSPRHKRRLYQSVFGLSRQQLNRLRAVHAFLEQNCDFEAGLPRVIGYVNPEVFYDQPHFNRAFKALTGLTPLKYFQTTSLLQDNLMAASYNAPRAEMAKL